MDQPKQAATPPAHAPRFGRLLGFLMALPFSLCVALAVLEVAARVLPIEMFSLQKLLPVSAIDQQRFQPHPYSTYIPRQSWHTPAQRKLVASHNSLGFRGAETTWEKPPGRLRIVCLGGSSTYGYTTTNDAATYPARLQVHLKQARPGLDVEVINGGAPGYTSFETLALLATRAIALQPDVLIVYHGLNDAQAALYRSTAHPEAPAQVDNTHYRSNWTATGKSTTEAWLEHSRAFLVLRRYLTDYAKLRTRLNATIVVDNDVNNSQRFDNPNPSPVGFANFERNLRSIIGIARAHGARVMLATQATDVEDFALGPGDPHGAQTLACRRNAETVRRVAGSVGGVWLAEIAPGLEALAAERRQAGKDDIFTSTVHFTDYGADLLAQRMVDELLKSGWLEGGD